VLPKDSAKEVDKIKLMSQCIQNIDDIDSSADDIDGNNETILEFNDAFNDTKTTINVLPIINNETTSNESDGTSIDEVIDSCFATCNRNGIDHYRSRTKENQIDFNDISESDDELKYEENEENSEPSNENHSPPIMLARISEISSSTDSDSDSKNKTKRKGKKGKCFHLIPVQIHRQNILKRKIIVINQHRLVAVLMNIHLNPSVLGNKKKE